VCMSVFGVWGGKGGVCCVTQFGILHPLPHQLQQQQQPGGVDAAGLSGSIMGPNRFVLRQRLYVGHACKGFGVLGRGGYRVSHAPA
jgi:hypothetical protein